MLDLLYRRFVCAVRLAYEYACRGVSQLTGRSDEKIKRAWVSPFAGDQQDKGRQQVYLLRTVLMGTPICVPVRLADQSPKPSFGYGTEPGEPDPDVTLRMRSLTSWDIPAWNSGWAHPESSASPIFEVDLIGTPGSEPLYAEGVRSTFWKRNRIP
jgi:hypothetical protein